MGDSGGEWFRETVYYGPAGELPDRAMDALMHRLMELAREGRPHRTGQRIVDGRMEMYVEWL